MPPFVRAFQHTACEPVANPDLTICVWDGAPALGEVVLYPFWNEALYGFVRRCSKSGPVTLEYEDHRLNLLNTEKNLALFWIRDVNEVHWFEQCRPFRDILHWWAATREIYLVHAACLATKDGAGALIVGYAGAGKSTTSLSSFGLGELDYVSDDLCFVEFHDGVPWAYGLYSAAKLETFAMLPHLEQHVWNPNRGPLEKAVIFTYEEFRDSSAAQARIEAVLVPTQTGRVESKIEPMGTAEARKALMSSMVDQFVGVGQTDFFGMYKICKSVPAFRLEAGTDLRQLNKLIAEQIRSCKSNSDTVPSPKI